MNFGDDLRRAGIRSDAKCGIVVVKDAAEGPVRLCGLGDMTFKDLFDIAGVILGAAVSTFEADVRARGEHCGQDDQAAFACALIRRGFEKPKHEWITIRSQDDPQEGNGT